VESSVKVTAVAINMTAVQMLSEEYVNRRIRRYVSDTPVEEREL